MSTARVFILSLFVVIASCTGVSDADRDLAVRSLWDRLTTALAVPDSSGYEALWVPDPSFRVTGPVAWDMDTFRERAQALFAAQQSSSHEVRSFEVEPYSIVDNGALAKIQVTASPSDQDSSHHFVIIAQFIDGEWYVVQAGYSRPPTDIG